jgi:hypothetical protein
MNLLLYLNLMTLRLAISLKKSCKAEDKTNSMIIYRDKEEPVLLMVPLKRKDYRLFQKTFKKRVNTMKNKTMGSMVK